jgi:uncharacterized membrane protein YphA (DoxX/SURF4 family)
MKYLTLAGRLILGVVFIFSGFVKSVDPLGSAYKFSDYFNAFKLSFLSFLALPLGVVLSAFEVVLGISLLLGYRRRITFRILFWFMGFFTLLTLILALFNPVTDCGCFGDAIILTNWETFLKNVVLMLFVVPLFMMRDHQEDVETNQFREWGLIASFYLLMVGFSLWNHAHLPLIDFRPYDVGTIIQEEMEIPDGAPVDEYETELVYREKASGETKGFTIENYPRDTTMWEFVSSESRLISKGFEPDIHDFAVMDKEGRDIIDQILSENGYSLMMISHDLNEADEEALQKARDWSQLEILAEGYQFYAVTATPSEEVNELSVSLDLGYGFYAADEIMLKTVVRSNPGFILIRNGVIVGKWSNRDFPRVGDLNPDWAELIGNAAVPLDEETQMLMEAGIYEHFSFDVVDFDPVITSKLLERSEGIKEGSMAVIFVLVIILLILFAHRIAPIRS